MSFTAQRFIHCNCFSVDKFNSKYRYKTYLAFCFFAMIIETKCYEVIGMCFIMLFFFNCKMPMQVLFQIKFPQNRCLVTSWEHRHSPYWSTWWFDCVHSFPTVWGHFLVFRVNLSWNGHLICTFSSIINWFNISDLLDLYKILRWLTSLF